MIKADFSSVIFQILFIWFIANKIFGKKKGKTETPEKKSVKQSKAKSSAEKFKDLKANFMDDLVKGLEDELGEFSGFKKKKSKTTLDPSESKTKPEVAYEDPFFDKKVSLEEELTPYEQPLESDVKFASDHLDSDLTGLPDFHSNLDFKSTSKRRRSAFTISGKSDLKKAIILKEILDKPLSLRKFSR